MNPSDMMTFENTGYLINARGASDPELGAKGACVEYQVLQIGKEDLNTPFQKQCPGSKSPAKI